MQNRMENRRLRAIVYNLFEAFLHTRKKRKSPQMKKIAFLCSNLKFGGIQRVAVKLANGLSRKGLNMEFAVLRGGGEFLSRLSPEVRLRNLDCTSQPLGLLSPFSPLAAYLRKERPDVVLSFGNSTNNLAGWAKLLLRSPFRLIVSERSTFGARMADDPAFHRWRRTVRSRFLYRQADLCVCVSRGVADDLVETGVVPRDKVRVIYNPVVDADLGELASCPASHPWFHDSARPVILSVGRLMQLKGLDELIKAFAIVREKHDRTVRLMILGEGYYRSRLEELVRSLGLSEDVCFAGFQENPYAYMSKASAVVLSSHYEGFPNVLAEALACGTNVVSTDCRSGPREILEDGKWGRLVPVGDYESLAEALREALRDPIPSDKLKEAAARFSSDRAIDAYCELLLEEAHPLVAGDFS